MSITKLKTLGGWPPRRRVRAVGAGTNQGTNIRGRIITGLLTGDAADADERCAPGSGARGTSAARCARHVGSGSSRSSG